MNQPRLPDALDTAQTFINTAYDALAASDPQFVPRPEQKLLSRMVADAFINSRPLAAEAPTGTGKTLAYLIGALAAAQITGLPVVVATATKALQSQLMDNDIPKLVRAGVLPKDLAALAKGKANYFCAFGAEAWLSSGPEDADLLDAEDLELQSDMEMANQMLVNFNQGTWHGDMDEWEAPMPHQTFRIRVNSETCTGAKCPDFRRCAYFKAKAKMATSPLIVANHDLALIDLMQAAEGSEATVFPHQQYHLVFDEGHHLSAKALEIGSTRAHLSELARRLGNLNQAGAIIWANPELASPFQVAGKSSDDFRYDDAALSLEHLMTVCDTLDLDDDTSRRFPRAQMPDELREAATELAGDIATVLGVVEDAVAALTDTLEFEKLSALGKKAHGQVMGKLLPLASVLSKCLQCLIVFAGTDRAVRWMSRYEEHLSLHTSPLEGADVLRPILWGASRATAVLVSATLRDIGGFTRLKASCGLPDNTRFEVLPHIFPYAESRLIVMGMHATPKQAERARYIEELRQKLPRAIDPKEGSLILFPSRALMRDMMPALKSVLGEELILEQGTQPAPLLVAQHKLRIDRGRGSVLCGLATMAEGLDLPGKYCTHVLITAIPFAVPTDPVEAELADLLGERYFSERSLPDAMVRLMQMVGRLIRRESDRGRVTLFDRRLASTSYGKRMLFALPPFKRVIEPVA